MDRKTVPLLIRRFFPLVAILVLMAGSAKAQDHPKAEIFAGGAYLAAGLNDDVNREDLGGFGVGVAGNFNRWFGVAFDYSLVFNGDGAQEHTYLAGPRFSARSDGYTVFGHVMAGGSTARVEGFNDTDPAAAIGGGIDLNAGRVVAIRFQGDYLPIFAQGTLHNFRVMAGVVFKLGGH
jgi:hypothetical protein